MYRTGNRNFKGYFPLFEEGRFKNVKKLKKTFYFSDKSDYKQIETFLNKISKTLPKENFITIDVKQSLIAAYRDVLRRDIKPSKHVLQRKLELCHDLLPLLNKIEPGISRLKGNFLSLYKSK